MAVATVLAIASVVTAGASAFSAVSQNAGARRARNAAQSLENDRRTQLANEASARAAAKAKAATAGRRTGTRVGSGLGLGFGSGTTTPGVGAGTLFGN